MSDQGFSVGRQLVDQRSRVTSRDVPLGPALLGAEATFATVPAMQMMKIRQLAACNPGATAGTVSLWVTISGVKLAQLVDYPVPANEAVDLTGLVGGLYPAGAVLTAAGDVVLSGWYEAVL